MPPIIKWFLKDNNNREGIHRKYRRINEAIKEVKWGLINKFSLYLLLFIAILAIVLGLYLAVPFIEIHHTYIIIFLISVAFFVLKEHVLVEQVYNSLHENTEKSAKYYANKERKVRNLEDKINKDKTKPQSYNIDHHE